MKRLTKRLLALNAALLLCFTLLIENISPAFAAETAVVLYDGSGGYTADGEMWYEQAVEGYDAVQLMGADLFTNEGYLFVGWEGPDGTLYEANETVRFADGEDAYLTAVWKELVCVEYYGDWGVTADGKRRYYQWVEDYDAVQLMDADLFTNEGYLFVGWEGTDGTLYEANETVRFADGEDAYLTAVWRRAEVTYYGSGGRTAEGERWYYQGIEDFRSVQLMGADLFTYDVDGYIFLGWETSDGTLYLENQIVDLGDENWLSAEWGQARVIYHGNGGVTEANETYFLQPVRYSWRGEAILSDVPFEKDGCYFVGWNTKEDGSGEWYAGGREIEAGSLELYAQWGDLSENYICYDADGSDIFDGKSRVYLPVDSFPAEITLPDIPDTEDYVSFAWSTAPGRADGERVNYTMGSTITVTENTTLYYQQVSKHDIRKNIYVMYYGNGAAHASGSTVLGMTASEGNLTLYGAEAFEKEGYFISGWNTRADGKGTIYALESEISRSYRGEVLRLYPVWQSTGGRAAVYCANGGSTKSGEAVYYESVASYDRIRLAKANVFSKDGYVFVGWQDMQGNMYEASEHYRFEKQPLLIARWAYAKVKYIGNGGTAEDGSDKVTQYVEDNREGFYDETVFERDGYAFVGWNTGKDGSGKWYPAGGEIAQGQEISLYAQWQKLPDGKYVRFCAEGTNALGGKTYEIVAADALTGTVRLPDLTDEDGCVYVGWSTVFENYIDPEVGGVTYTPGTEIAVDKTMDLYVWSLSGREYGIIYDANGGIHVSGSTVIGCETSGGNLKLYGPENFEKDGAILVGWNTKANGSGKSYAPYATVTAAELNKKSLRLYARWSNVSGEYIVYGGNGGVTKSGESLFVQQVSGYDDVVLAGADLFSCDGKAFLGWQDIDGKNYKEGDSVAFDGPAVLLAKWGYARVTYHGNGGVTEESETSVVQYAIREERFLEEDTFSKDGYVFVGWNTKQDGSGTWHLAYGEMETGGIMELYAQWVEQPKRYVCFDANGFGALDGRSCLYVTVDEFPCEVTLPDIHSSEGYAYIGWGTRDWMNNNYTTYTPGSTITATENTTLYALELSTRWDYVVVYNGNGGLNENDSAVEVLSCPVDSLATAPYLELYESRLHLQLKDSDTFEREGYVLQSWNTKADGSGQSFAPGEWVDLTSVTEDGALHLHACWKLDPTAKHTLVFDVKSAGEGTVAYAAVYDALGKMICIVPAETGEKYLQAEIPYLDYLNMSCAKLFRLDQDSFEPLKEVSVLRK